MNTSTNYQSLFYEMNDIYTVNLAQVDLAQVENSAKSNKKKSPDFLPFISV